MPGTGASASESTSAERPTPASGDTDFSRIQQYMLEFARGRRWGDVTFHYQDGKIEHVTVKESFKPAKLPIRDVNALRQR